MQTHVESVSETTPWLDFYQVGSSTADRIKLETTPFTIGRVESCDFTIDSQRVSREHAVIESKGWHYVLKDLKSTNGTFVNGHRIEEAILQDGDLLMFADTEIGFYTGARDTKKQSATQVMPPSHENEEAARAVIRAIRRTHEEIVQGGVDRNLQPIICLATSVAVGYDGGGRRSRLNPSMLDPPSFSLPPESELALRLLRLRRRVAAEQAAPFDTEVSVFLEVAASEIGNAALLNEFERLRKLSGSSCQMVAAMPARAVLDNRSFRQFRDALHQAGVGVSYDDFAGGESQVSELQDIAPDYLRLASGFLPEGRDLGGRRRQLEHVIRLCRELNCTVVATGIQSAEQAQAYAESGCELAQGPLYQPRQSAA